MTTAGDYVKLHLIVFLWGFTAILGLLIQVSPYELVAFRTLLAAAGMAVVIAFTTRNFSVPLRDLIKIMLTGFIVAAHWITFFGAARMSNASVSLVGFATASLWTAFIEPLMNRKKVVGFEVLLGLVVLAGLYVIYRFDFAYPVGLLIAVFSGFLSALFFVINAQLSKRIPTRVITCYEMAGAFIGTVLYLIVHKTLVDPGYSFNLVPTLMDWVYLLILSLACTVYAYNVSLGLMKKLSVFSIQLTINLEPVYGIALAVLVFGEREKMNLPFYIGASLILAAVISYPVFRRRMRPDPIYDLPSERPTPL